MKKIFALCAALGLCLVMAVPALAAGAPPTSNKGGNTTIQYSASYSDLGGPVTCTGIHQYGKQWPGTATTGGQDKFTCTSSTGSPLTNVTPGQVWPFPVAQWASDYFNSIGLSVTNTVAFSVTVSSDGFSYSGVAQYF
jgi:hypothetical protein